MASREHSPEMAAGTVVAGKYQLLERLGGGGMGEVYRAEHQLAGRVVALKILRPDHAQDENLTRRFFQEAQAANKIRHPNIVDVLDAGLSEQGPYVVMECLEGVSLSLALSRLGTLPEGAALAIVLPMLDALDAAHRRGIVHRDLKPENVFLARLQPEAGSPVTVKLLDFGIAKVLDVGQGSSPETHTGVIFGTPDYLSPEQATGEGVLDGRSDLFAVGIVLFELLTGRRPFEAPTAVATAYRIAHAAAPTLGQMGVRADPRIQSALDIALSKSKEDRFSSAGAFADMLAPIVPDGATRREVLKSTLAKAIAAAPPAPPRRDNPPDKPAPSPMAPSVVSVLGPTERPPALPEPTPSPSPMAATMQSVAPPVRPAEPTRPSPAPRAEQKPASGRTSFSIADRAGSRPSPEPRSRPVAVTPPAVSPARPSQDTPRRTGPLSPARPWVPRPLPSHAAGACHVRGTLPRAVNRWIERAYGESGRDSVLRQVPRAQADLFRSDGFNALVWYDLESLDTFVEAATHTLLRGETTQWRAFARDNFEKDLVSLFRSARTGDVPGILKRSPASWSKIFDFGTMRVSDPSTPGRVNVKVEGFDTASLALRYATIGTMEGLVRGAGFPGATVRVLAGEASFARDFEYEMSWVARG